MNNSITESQLDNSVHALAESLKASGIVLGENNLCDLNDTLSSFLTENCAVNIKKDEPKHVCPHCGADLTAEHSVIRDYTNKSDDEEAEDVSAFGHYEGDDRIFENDSFSGFGGESFDLRDDSDKCESCNGQL